LRSLSDVRRIIAGESPHQTGCRPIREALSHVYKSFGVSTPELPSSQHRDRP
jgi:hypothetical protein